MPNKIKIEYKPFDRKKFNPETNDSDLNTLYKLRNKGWTRRVAFRQAKDNNFKDYPYPNKYHRLQSTSMWYLRTITEPYDGIKASYKNKVFCDFGCGQSPDGMIAIDLGFKKSILIDLFRVRENWEKGIEFVKGDICEKLPIKEQSIDYAICQAVIDLIRPEERKLFYKNAFKLLKPGGYLAVYIINLKVGYGFNILREAENAMDSGFYLERKFNDGFIVQKPTKQ